MNRTDLSDRAAAAYAALLQEGRDEARSHLELLSNGQLERDVIQTWRELAEIGEDQSDLLEVLPRVLTRIGVGPQEVDAEQVGPLLERLAEVARRVDREDLAHAEELLARRRREGVDRSWGRS